MIRNLSYNNKETNREVNEAVGKAFSFIQVLKMKGNGSQRLLINEASTAIQDYLKLDNNLNHCNIELRPKGIIIRFRSLLETIGWVIPYHQLTLYQNGSSISLYDGREQLKLSAAGNQKINRAFMIKLLDGKNQISSIPV